MKKLESLEVFQRKAMNKEMMGKITGGLFAPPEGGVCTGGGSFVRGAGTPQAQTITYSADCMGLPDGDHYYPEGNMHDTPQC